MNRYRDLIYDVENFDDYFQDIREDVNSKNSFKEASYFIRKNSRTEAIQKNLIFYKIYGNAILGYNNLSEDSYLIVSLEKENHIIKYIRKIGKKEKIYMFLIII
jgi:hypothetical protein